MPPQAGSRRNFSPEKHESSERWLLTYADLITLLLAFFILMFGMSSADAQKFSRLADSMRKAFNVGVLQGGSDVGILQSASDLAAVQESSDSETDGSRAREMEMIYTEMNMIARLEGLGDRVSVALRPEGIAIALSGNLLFASGRADLRPDAANLLHSIGRALSRIPNAVRVEGHTDDVVPAGTEYSSNWELSGARAVAVVRHLADVEGIDPGRLAAAAYSQFRPVAGNDAPRDRARNRRAEIVILYPNTAPAGMARPLASVPGSFGDKE